MLQFYAGLYCTESNVAHKVQRYTNLFVASRRASRSWSPTLRGLFLPLLLAGCGARPEARTEVFTAEGAEYAESENQYSFVVKQFCTSTGVSVPAPCPLVTHSKRQRAERLNPCKDRRELEGERKRRSSWVIPDRGHNTCLSRQLSPWRLV